MSDKPIKNHNNKDAKLGEEIVKGIDEDLVGLLEKINQFDPKPITVFSCQCDDHDGKAYIYFTYDGFNKFRENVRKKDFNNSKQGIFKEGLGDRIRRDSHEYRIKIRIINKRTRTLIRWEFDPKEISIIEKEFDELFI